MSTYLVTGAAGFIASKVCELLLADGHTVVGIDNLNDYYDVRLKDYRLGQLLGDVRWMTNSSTTISAYGNVGRLTAESPSSARFQVVSATTCRKEERTRAGSRKNPGADFGYETVYPTSIDTSGSGPAGAFIFERLDIENLVQLDALFSEFKFDAVINLAARAGVRYSLMNPHVYMSTNASGTLNLLECQRKYGVEKHVLASTSSLYAGCPMPFTEDQPVNTPLSPYAASKKAAEMIAYSYHELFGIDVSVLRHFTVFGPAGRPDMAPFRFVKWIAEGTSIKLLGDGRQTRDFTFVDDIARGTVLALKKVGYQTFNIGGGRDPVSLNTTISWIEGLVGRKARIEALPASRVDMQETRADITKAAKELGWVPLCSTFDGFSQVVKWHLGNSDFIRTVHV